MVRRRLPRCCRHCHRLERLHRRTRRDVDRRAWIAAAQTKLKMFQAEKDEYWLTHVRDDGRSTKLRQTLSSLLARL